MRVTISMPCYSRPQRTRRAINSILAQDCNQWEALIVGDGCQVFEKIVNEYEQGTFHEMRFQGNKGNRLCLIPMKEHYGGCGYHWQNINIKNAKGKYFCLMANDDVICENHISSYLSEIEGTGYDFVYFDDWTLGKHHKTKLRHGHVGDNCLIIRTEFLQQMPERGPEYGHDWQLISDMMLCGARYKKSKNPPTYRIMSNADNRVDLEGLD